jgi:HlyD family secretion protein
MQKKNLVLLAAGGLVAAALLVWAFRPQPVGVEAAVVANGHYEQSIEEDGQTRVKDRYTISAPVAARLLRIALREGDPVRAGQPVAELVPVMSTMIDARSAQEAEARWRAATANVTRAAAEIERRQVALREAQLQLQRSEQLANEGFVAPSRLDSDRLALAGARRDREMARAEREAAVHEQAQAAAALQPASGSVVAGKPLTVRSPVDGVVLKVAQPSEATLPAGTPLLDAGDPARMEVYAELLTTDAVQAQPGTRAVIERWGGPPVQGHVRRVEPGAFTKVSALGIEEQRVKVIVDVDDPPPAWHAMGDGYRVTLRVITKSVDQAVIVPVGAIFPLPEGGTAVYRIEGGRARLQPIELGGRNGTDAWVRTGLQPGQSVIVYPPPTVEDGKRVEVRRP